jgi:hypothetical protein
VQRYSSSVIFFFWRNRVFLPRCAPRSPAKVKCNAATLANNSASNRQAVLSMAGVAL